jgi:very-short-patch-repair endonuclease
VHCLDEENALAAMESAIHEGYLSIAEVERIGILAPRRLQGALRRMVTNSGSGNETIVRYRLQQIGYVVEAQAFVPGMGHEDLLVEGCVGVDVDGRRWHEGDDRFANDRDRDIHVEGLGRRTLRLRTSHIFEPWPHTLAVIDRVVRDAKREQRQRAARFIVKFDDPL